ncbi:hypothetical protein H5410_002152 [Solanum commersonii]|uniref:Uncharacterized protein n=1 Tax=Solanum commersonii TaxID=4109 RepID=A0A9J6B1J5_SOLCO|nr:hypothetical protein H5410_002152 [Solanum commersonii]
MFSTAMQNLDPSVYTDTDADADADADTDMDVDPDLDANANFNCELGFWGYFGLQVILEDLRLEEHELGSFCQLNGLAQM